MKGRLGLEPRVQVRPALKAGQGEEQAGAQMGDREMCCLPHLLFSINEPLLRFCFKSLYHH